MFPGMRCTLSLSLSSRVSLATCTSRGQSLSGNQTCSLRPSMNAKKHSLSCLLASTDRESERRRQVCHSLLLGNEVPTQESRSFHSTTLSLPFSLTRFPISRSAAVAVVLLASTGVTDSEQDARHGACHANANVHQGREQARRAASAAVEGRRTRNATAVIGNQGPGNRLGERAREREGHLSLHPHN